MNAPSNKPEPAAHHRPLRCFVAQVKREGTCPARLRAGDRMTLVGPALRTEGCRPCAYAICDLVPAIRTMERALGKGEAKPASQSVVCSSCANPERPVEFTLSHVPRGRRPRKVSPEQQKLLTNLKRFPLLKPLPDTTLLRIATRVRRATYRAGTVLLTQGEKGRQLFLVDRGEVGVHRKDGRKSKQIARIKTGECFGEMSLLTGEPISATIRAATSVELLVLDQQDFKALLVANPGMNHYFNRLVTERVAKTEVTQRIEPGMFGSLADFTPAELMQSLQLAHRGGRLSIQRDKDEVTIDFVGGQPYHVLTKGDLDENPEEAIYQILYWTRGRYEFDPLEKIAGRSFFKDMTALLIEGIRYQNEAELGRNVDARDQDIDPYADSYEPTPYSGAAADGPSERGEFGSTKALKTIMQKKQAAKADGQVQVRGKLGLKIRVGSIWLAGGRIVAAAMEDLDGAPALKQIVKIKSGEWAFGDGEPPDGLRSLGRYGVEEMFGKGL